MKKTEVETHSGPSNNILNIHLGISGLEASEPNRGKFGSSSASFLVLTYSNIYHLYNIYHFNIYIYIHVIFADSMSTHSATAKSIELDFKPNVPWICSPLRGRNSSWPTKLTTGKRARLGGNRWIGSWRRFQFEIYQM